MQKLHSLLVIGGLHVDEVASSQGPFVDKASNPVKWQRFVGGVASNTARAANSVFENRQAGAVLLHAAIGEDELSDTLVSSMRTQGIDVTPHIFEEHQTGRYSAIMADSGELLMGFADVELAEKLNPASAISVLNTGQVQCVGIDANLSTPCIESVVKAACNTSTYVAALAVSPSKVVRLLPLAKNINLLFCNRREAFALGSESGLIPHQTTVEQIPLSELARILFETGFKEFVLTDGAEGLITGNNDKQSIHAAAQVPITHNVNGAGDTLAGATLAAITLGATLNEAVGDYGIPMAYEVITGNRLPIPL